MPHVYLMVVAFLAGNSTFLESNSYLAITFLIALIVVQTQLDILRDRIG